MSRGGGGVEKALVQTFDENDCVDGWAIQVTGLDAASVGLECFSCLDENNTLVTGNTFFAHGSSLAAHVHTTGIDTTAIPILGAATRQFLRVDALITNGTVRTFLAFSLQPGGTLTQNLATGAETFQYRLNGDGSFDVRRTAGALTGESIVRILSL